MPSKKYFEKGVPTPPPVEVKKIILSREQEKYLRNGEESPKEKVLINKLKISICLFLGKLAKYLP